jgi:hypothetical protein
VATGTWVGKGVELAVGTGIVLGSAAGITAAREGSVGDGLTRVSAGLPAESLPLQAARTRTIPSTAITLIRLAQNINQDT